MTQAPHLKPRHIALALASCAALAGTLRDVEVNVPFLPELTGGELYASPKVPLDSAAIARLRNRAARYGHAG